MPEPKLVMIEWFDSHHTTGWHSSDPDTRPLLCRSVGWLIHDGDQAKTIAPHMTEEEVPQRCGEMTIPTCAVVKVRVIRRVGRQARPVQDGPESRFSRKNGNPD